MAESSAHQLSIAESLKSLGLTKYEALVYIGLLKAAGATATEIHEISGVPRASVYPVLDRLSQKNLVSISHTTPRRFNPIPPNEAIENLLKTIGADATKAKKILTRIYEQRTPGDRAEQELIWSIYGVNPIRTRLIDLLEHASSQIQIIFYWGMLKKELTDLLFAASDSVQIEVITDYWDGPVPGGMKVYVKNPPKGHDNRSQKSLAGGVFLIDGQKALVIMGSKDEGFTALYSESRGFIRFFSMYWNFIASWAKMPDQ